MIQRVKQVLLLAWLAIGLLPAAANAADLKDWQYRWGDSPFAGETPMWATASPDSDRDSATWTDIDFPSNPPGRDGNSMVWFRTTLPRDAIKDPVIYIYSIDLLAEVYLEGQRIYRFGQFTGEDSHRFIGWPWHQIRLPANYTGKQLYIRVYSDYRDIGLWGEIRLMNRAELLEYIIDNNYPELIISAFCLMIALLGFACLLVAGASPHIGYLSLFSLATAVMLTGENQATQLFCNAPLLLRYFAVGGYFLLPVCIALLLSHWLDNRRGARIMRLVAALHLLYCIAAISLSLSGQISLSSVYPPFDLLFACSLLLIIHQTLRHIERMSHEQRFIMLAFCIFAAYLLIDMAIAHELLSWRQFTLGPGALLFTITMVLVSIHHYQQMQRGLRELNVTLEKRVEQRTLSLQQYADEHRQQAEQIAQTHNCSIRLGQLVTELQNAKSYDAAVAIVKQGISRVFDPLQAVILELDKEPVSGDTPRRHYGSYPISIQDLSGNSQPFAQLVIGGNKQAGPASILQEAFAQRAAERIGLTLSNAQLKDELQALSLEDPLTGLKNRRCFDQAIGREMLMAAETASPLCLMICDIDHFKRFNDEYGHDAGDETLKAVATILAKYYPPPCHVCRLGGEEFVIIMPGVAVAEAVARADSLLERIARLKLYHREHRLGRLTISIGLTSLNDRTGTAEDFFRSADEALYRAKSEGRNRLSLAQPA